MPRSSDPTRSHPSPGAAYRLVIGVTLMLSAVYLLAVAPLLEPFPNNLLPLPLLVQARNVLPLAGLALLGLLWLFSCVWLLLELSRRLSMLAALAGVLLATILACGGSYIISQPLFQTFILGSLQTGSQQYYLVSQAPAGLAPLFVYRCDAAGRSCERSGPYAAAPLLASGYCSAEYRLKVNPITLEISVDTIRIPCGRLPTATPRQPRSALPANPPALTNAAVDRLPQPATPLGQSSARISIRLWSFTTGNERINPSTQADAQGIGGDIRP